MISNSSHDDECYYLELRIPHGMRPPRADDMRGPATDQNPYMIESQRVGSKCLLQLIQSLLFSHSGLVNCNFHMNKVLTQFLNSDIISLICKQLMTYHKSISSIKW